MCEIFDDQSHSLVFIGALYLSLSFQMQQSLQCKSKKHVVETDKHLLRNGVFCPFDFSEELLRTAIVEWKLPIHHGEQDHAKGPHVTGFTSVRLTCQQILQHVNKKITTNQAGRLIMS